MAFDKEGTLHYLDEQGIQYEKMEHKAVFTMEEMDEVGISAKGGVTTHHAEEAVIDRMMAAGAKHRLIVADSSKIGKAGFSRVCECSELLTLVTNTGGDRDALAQLEETGVNIRFSAEA